MVFSNELVALVTLNGFADVRLNDDQREKEVKYLIGEFHLGQSGGAEVEESSKSKSKLASRCLN